MNEANKSELQKNNNSPSTPPEARARECDCIYYDTENGNARFIEYSAYQNMRRERDEAVAKNAYLQKNYADAKADLKIALEQRERYRRALEYAKTALPSFAGWSLKEQAAARAEIERILHVDAESCEG